MAAGAITVAHSGNSITAWDAGSIAGRRINLTAQGGGVGNEHERPIVLDTGVLPTGATRAGRSV